MMAHQIFQPEKDTRSAPRSHLFLSGMIHFGNISAAIRLRDLSATGARVEGATLPAIGASATISRGSLHATGTIIWRNHKGCGLHFDTPLLLDEWMPEQSARDQMAVDAMVEAVRSDSADVLPLNPVTPAAGAIGERLPQRLAEELAYVARLLDSLGDDLCGEPLVVMRHAAQLQNLDISAQILGHVAAVLVADQPEQAIQSIGMTGLRKRLQRTAL